MTADTMAGTGIGQIDRVSTGPRVIGTTTNGVTVMSGGQIGAMTIAAITILVSIATATIVGITTVAVTTIAATIGAGTIETTIGTIVTMETMGIVGTTAIVCRVATFRARISFATITTTGCVIRHGGVIGCASIAI
jgi:hypothetical protein